MPRRARPVSQGFAKKKLGAVLQNVSHGPKKCLSLFSKHVVTHYRIDFNKKIQWGVAIFANVRGSRSCVPQSREVVIVVYSA